MYSGMLCHYGNCLSVYGADRLSLKEQLKNHLIQFTRLSPVIFCTLTLLLLCKLSSNVTYASTDVPFHPKVSYFICHS